MRKEKTSPAPFDFHDLSSWRGRNLYSKGVTNAKRWYQEVVGDGGSRKCPVCISLSSDLAELIRSTDIFKFATAIGGAVLLIGGTVFAAMLRSFQLGFGYVIGATATPLIAVVALFFIYYRAQRDHEERIAVAFKLMEFSRMNEVNASAVGRQCCFRHK